MTESTSSEACRGGSRSI